MQLLFRQNFLFFDKGKGEEKTVFIIYKKYSGGKYIMQISIAGKYRTLIIRLDGDLDHHSTGKLRDRIDRELKRTGAVNAALDFSNVSFMDSSGIGFIMGRYKIVHALGGKVILYGISDNVRRIIEMSGIDKLVVTAKNLEYGLMEVGV